MVLGVALGALAVLGLGRLSGDDTVTARLAPDAALGAAPGAATLVVDEPERPDRTVDAYTGLGTWVDVFDFSPAYQDGADPAVGPDALDEMADNGVRTVFLQAARLDRRTPDGLESPWLLYQFLRRAHAHGMQVVGWYLPLFGDLDADLRRLGLIDDFDVFGQRFDGVAVDIEDTSTVPDPDARSERLVELSQRLRDDVGEDALGAIIVPPVQTEVINERFWPAFPYRELAPLYDVWLPMSYWTFRTESSGYRDGFTYNEESVRRLRDNLGDDDALVHSIGGIGDLVTPEELRDFATSLAATGSIGGSIYDWSTLSPEARALLAEEFATGAAADLPSP